MSQAVRTTALRAGGACVRCRKGKTKCVYENGRAPCKNCAKGMHECYLPSESMSHGGHGVSPAARLPQRARDSLPSDRGGVSSADRQGPLPSAASRHILSTEKLTPELVQECERVISKTIPACVAFHKPSFLQQLKSTQLDSTMVYALLTTAARHSPVMIRRYGGHASGATAAAEHFASKTINLIMASVDQPSLADIQALCLLVVHEWGCRNAVRAYVYLGQAARMAQMYRIVHTHHHQGDPEQFLLDESLRRTLWLIYILDCFLTSSPGRHPALSSRDMNGVALPCQDMNYHFGNPVAVRTLSDAIAPTLGDLAPPGEVGEFGHIVLATQAWRNVVGMMTTTTLQTFSEDQCLGLEQEIDGIRQSLPLHFTDKSGNLNLHITMGSGYTYAIIHCLLYCGTIFLNRRRLLQTVTAEDFNPDAWRTTPQAHELVDRILAASHSILLYLLTLEHGADKDSVLCFPIFMLFSCFTAGSTVAYLALKGLAPPTSAESASNLVRDSLRFCQDGAESWPLVGPWHRHLSVMSKVLREVNLVVERDQERDDSKSTLRASPSVKDDALSQADTNPDAMEFEHTQLDLITGMTPQAEDRVSEPPAPRKPGIATINGGSAGLSTPATVSPPREAQGPVKYDSPDPTPSTGTIVANMGPEVVDMTAQELCSAFERQLLELDDLAAFMGGGV